MLTITLWMWIKTLLWIITQTKTFIDTSTISWAHEYQYNKKPTQAHTVMWPSLAYSIQRDRFSNRLLFSNGKHWQSCVDSSTLRSWLSDLQPNLNLKTQHATCLMAETRQLHGDVDDGITAARGQSFNKCRGSDRNGKKLLGTPWGCGQTFG